jgi:hypothetical protein
LALESRWTIESLDVYASGEKRGQTTVGPGSNFVARLVLEGDDKIASTDPDQVSTRDFALIGWVVQKVTYTRTQCSCPALEQEPEPGLDCVFEPRSYYEIFEVYDDHGLPPRDSFYTGVITSGWGFDYTFGESRFLHHTRADFDPADPTLWDARLNPKSGEYELDVDGETVSTGGNRSSKELPPALADWATDTSGKWKTLNSHWHFYSWNLCSDTPSSFAVGGV